MFRLFKYTGFLLFLPIWWLQLLIPRDRKIWVFGAWYGNRFSDNSKSLYNYVKENHPEITTIWLTRKISLRDLINNEGGKSHLTNSFKGIYYSLLAKRIIVSSGKRDINYLFVNGADLIQLWHGNPMKQIGLDDRFSVVNSFFQRKIVPVLFPFVCEFNYDYVVSNSGAFSEKMASAFNVSISRILETGCPRNDIFFSNVTDAYNDSLRSKFKGAKLIYYLPTFRNQNGTRSLFTLEDYNQGQLEAFLERENIVFVSKGHYVDNRLGKETVNPNSRIINLSDDNVNDINLMLKDADLLITDYSGAYFDFLLTKKPIVFAAFDIEEYKNSSREMYFDYEDSIAGPIVKDWQELMKCLGDIWENNDYYVKRIEKNTIFNKHHDSNNSKRVYEAILNIER